MKKALIVEDEIAALEDLRDSLLEIVPSLEIVGAGNASEALEALAHSTFDAIFLDIDLPGMSGIQMLQRLPPPKPPVILVTGHALNAVDAFGLGVIECLLKPVDQERLRRAVVHIESLVTPADLSAPALQKTPEDRILLRENEITYFLRVCEISHIVSEGGATRVFFRDQNVLIPRTLLELKARMDSGQFFCARPGIFVNLDLVDQITISSNECLIAYLKDSKQIEFSTEQSRAFEERYQL